LAKQAQFRGDPPETGANCVKQTQFTLTQTGLPPGSSMQNKANFGQSARDPAAQLRETKPNLGRMGHLGDGAPVRSFVRNKANSRSHSCDIASMPRFGKQGQFCGKSLQEKRLW
jgi:hypothetical protein